MDSIESQIQHLKLISQDKIFDNSQTHHKMNSLISLINTYIEKIEAFNKNKESYSNTHFCMVRQDIETLDHAYQESTKDHEFFRFIQLFSTIEINFNRFLDQILKLNIHSN
ncbi:hypothetical protein HZS_8036 [Henneguya salminicola]|nr:hypothetical protein HZS_8036 [Henneguya salminicola]